MMDEMHPFDSSKWGRICNFLTNEGVLDKNKIVEPLEASKEDLLVVHPESYLDNLKCSANVSMIIEVPLVAMIPNFLVQKRVLRPFRMQVGGSILAAKLAKEQGWAINVGGGFHHCSAENGGGFCAYADITLCIHYAFVRLNISRVMIIDLDAHQGNGHETDFSDDRRVYIMDMYNSQIYPLDFEARRYIDQKIELPSGTRTREYLEQLDQALEISPEGVVMRDEKVFRFAKEKNVPIVMLTSGGYMKSSARVIADSIINLSKNNLIDLNPSI